MRLASYPENVMLGSAINNLIFWDNLFLQRDFGKRLTLGGEIFAQGKSSEDIRSFAVFNWGVSSGSLRTSNCSFPAATAWRAVTIQLVI